MTFSQFFIKKGSGSVDWDSFTDEGAGIVGDGREAAVGGVTGAKEVSGGVNRDH